MAFYTWLRPSSDDEVDTLKTKRRGAQKIKSLHAALTAHIDAAKLPEDMNLPSDASKFVRIATWNIREFDSSSYGYRSPETIAYSLRSYRPLMLKPGSEDAEDDFSSSYASWRTHQMSDHLPMWLELHIDFARQYPDEVEADIQMRLDGCYPDFSLNYGRQIIEEIWDQIKNLSFVKKILSKWFSKLTF